MNHAVTPSSYPHTLCNLPMGSEINFSWGAIIPEYVTCPCCKALIQDELFLRPDWAVGPAATIKDLGAQLCTRDGRKIGNAVVIDCETSESLNEIIYIVLTDAGNKLRLTVGELEEFFWPARWIMKPDDALGWAHYDNSKWPAIR